LTPIEKFFKGAARQVDAALKKFLPRPATAPRKIHEAIHYCVFPGGKRIRPIVALSAAEALGGAARSALPSACALELIHCYSLVHDDLPCMDDDDFRRGKPSCHKKFDEATAVLAGDALLTLAFEIVARHTPERARVADLIEALAEGAGSVGMVGGQVLDLEQKPLNQKNVEGVHAKKTAALFVASAKMGAISAGAPAATVEALGRYGRNLGMLFQTIDDLLDIGEEGRLTMPGALGAEKAYGLAKGFAKAAQDAIMPLSTRGSRLGDIVQFVLNQTNLEKLREAERV
jgi:geranylgeranyl diphosphate synthase type II